MVQEIQRENLTSDFPETSPAANPVFFRTYSRRTASDRETWSQVCDRTISGLAKLGKLTPQQIDLLHRMMSQIKSLPSGRWLWIGGTDWIENPENFSGAYNCTSTNVVDWRAFGLMMDLAMMGCGTGAVIEPKYINQLPPIRNHLNLFIQGEIGSTPPAKRRQQTEVKLAGNRVTIYLGDSRQGWVKSYQTLLELSTDERFSGEVQVFIELSDIRPAGEPLKGFGGVANPIKLPELYQRCAAILNQAVGRQLNSVECCLLIDEAAVTIVAGNIRRCLPEDALVHTDQGLVPIKDVQIGDLVQTPWGFKKVTNKFDQGYQEVYEIETTATYPRATLNHQQAVLGSTKGEIVWKRIIDLAPGDRLFHNPEILPGISTDLPPDLREDGSTNSRTDKTLQIPSLTPEIAWLIGLTHGNGEVSLGRNPDNEPYGYLSWTANALDQNLTNKLLVKLNSAIALFGLSVSAITLQEQNTICFSCSSIGLAQYFRKYIKQPNQPIQIPAFILQASSDIRAAYLAGILDSNGNLENHTLHLLTTVYQSFSRQIAAVISSLGIAGQIKIHVNQEQNWQPKYSITLPALPEKYNNLIAPHAVKGKWHQGLKMYSFPLPSETRRESYTYSEMGDLGFQGSHRVEANYQRYIAESDLDLDISVTVKGLGSYDYVHTYDIEVEDAHCFYCDGYLTHNSAGMRQGNSNDQLFSNAKSNLWQQDQNGNWRIDPERDALRMANHSRVFHYKPTLEECIEAVRQQYYSGEGAIQWAGEALARGNCDLLLTQELKKEFLQAYEQGKAQQWIAAKHPDINAEEIEHRLSRFGLNPCGEILGSNFHCVAGDTLIISHDGLHKIQDIVGQEIEIWNGCRWSKVVPLRTNTGQKLYRVRFGDGSYLDVTEYHRFFVKDRFGKAYQEVQTKDLLTHSKYRLHTEPFVIKYEDGDDIDPDYAYTLGIAVSDGTLDQKGNAKIRLYSQKAELIVSGKKSAERNYDYLPSFGDITELGFSGELLHRLKTNADALNMLASWNKRAILAFMAGLADTDGAHTQSNGIRIYVSDYERARRLQLLLSKCAVWSFVNLMARQDSSTNLGKRSEDIYYLEITDCSNIPCQRIDTSQGCQSGFKGKEQTIQSVEELPGCHDTYCFNEPEFHKGVFGNTLTGNCNLSEIHLNQLDPNNYQEQEEAFSAGALSVAVLLNHKFQEPRYQYSRELDPIVGVSFTGLFDFFVKAFGVDWLRWWAQGRPDSLQGLEFKQQEEAYLNRWREIVERVVGDYCLNHHLQRPNRCTTVQPSGTKSLLTGASPGWHPPKAQRFIRRVTFRKNDPVALACIDYGYSVVPSQSDKDENGNLLIDPFDSRCTEWLVEIPVAVSWADLPGADEIDISKFSAIAQLDFCLQVQKHYVRHNTSATIELRENEVELLGTRIYQAIRDDEGYISAALLSRFDDHQSFPRLPFEPISKAQYDQLMQEVKLRRKIDNFHTALSHYDHGYSAEAGPAGCDSDKCLLPEIKPISENNQQ